MRVLVTGSSGLLGSALGRSLVDAGHTVTALVRRAAGPEEISWDPEGDRLDPASLAGADAAVHLAGDNIAAGRWTDAKKARIRGSRVKGTDLLARKLALAEPRPRVLVSASAVGYYGDQGDRLLDEDAPPGSGFLADLVKAWEEATAPARDAGLRVVRLRIGVVLTPRGGALAKILPPFKLGVGGKMGPGTQYMSFISLPDLVSVIRYALETESLDGPVNAVAPEPVTNGGFTLALGKAVHRPAIFSMPAFVARLAFGQMADEALLSSTRAVPRRLQESGFRFQHPDVGSALAAVLGQR